MRLLSRHLTSAHYRHPKQTPTRLLVCWLNCRYGCEKKPGKDVTPLGPGLPVPGSLGGLSCVPARHQERIFPLMLALNAPDLFSYRACNFKVCGGCVKPTAKAWRLHNV